MLRLTRLGVNYSRFDLEAQAAASAVKEPPRARVSHGVSGR